LLITCKEEFEATRTNLAAIRFKLNSRSSNNNFNQIRCSNNKCSSNKFSKSDSKAPHLFKMVRLILLSWALQLKELVIKGDAVKIIMGLKLSSYQVKYQHHRMAKLKMDPEMQVNRYRHNPSLPIIA